MIRLANEQIVYVVTAKIENWTNNDVCKWLAAISNGNYKKYISKFKQRKTNGFDLLNLSRVQLQNNIGMLNPTLRNRLLREIKLLKIATRPTPNLLKKRSSAINFADIKKINRSSHRKSASNVDKITRSKSYEFAKKSVPRKLGPRDIGRARYKGTDWDRDLFKHDFLEEKIDYKATKKEFNKRKRRNPVSHKETVDEIGISKDFENPIFLDDVMLDIKKSKGWLADKPISRRNADLDKLRGTKVCKHERDVSRPIGWEPIKYEFKNDSKDWLEEHFWFDGSGVQFNFGFISKLLSCLPPAQQLKLNKMEAPTGYESKLNWLKMLLKMVEEERKVIEKEDKLIENEDDVINNIVPVQVPVQVEDESGVKVQQPVMMDSSSTSASSEDEVLSSPSCSSSSMDMMTKRNLYKRNRANTSCTTLSNSNLLTSPKLKRKMSRQDLQRRRFISQDSIHSIRSIIENIEKKRNEK